MLKFALKNMAVKKLQILLIVLSIVISAGVGVLAYNVAEQVSDGISGTAGYYSAIVGPAGSKTQLAMNTMYFTDEPLGTIPYSVVEELRSEMTVRKVIPFAMADNYNGFSVVGTTPAFLADKSIDKGNMFAEDAEFQVVVGSAVAKINDLSVGDEIYTSHAVGDTHTQPLTVVGILEETHTAYDNVVFTQLSTLWCVHDHGDADEEHEHEHAQGEVCAVLVKTTNPSTAIQLVNKYDGKIFNVAGGESFTLQAIEPMDTVRGVLEEADTTKYIVFVLCAIIILMNIMIISIITLLNAYHSAKEIALMRLIGISMRRINLLYVIQNGIIGLISIALAFGVSRICLLFMQDYVSSMGVVLNLGRVYPLEWVILLAIFAISVIPTIISNSVSARRDSICE